MRVFRPLPRGLSRSLSALVVLAWLGQMGLLYRSIQASTPYNAIPTKVAAE